MAKQSRHELPRLRSNLSGSSTGKSTRRRGRRDRFSSETAPIVLPQEMRSELAREREISRISEQFTDYDTPQAAAPRRRTRRRTSGIIRLLRGVCIVAALVFLLYSAAALLLLSRLNRVPRGERTVISGTLDRLYVRTVLLIGTDSRDLTEDRGRSDSMILVTLNSRTHEIGLHSLLRDSWVTIPGYGEGRLNAAYSQGGAELLMDTIEQNYNVSVDDYVCVGFQGFAGVIDALGGVELTISDEEADAINRMLSYEVNSLMGEAENDGMLSSGGTLLLDGKQALSYTRIRYVGNADFERTSRQREVMTALSERVREQMLSAAPKLARNALPHITTNMNLAELYLLSLRAPFLTGYSMAERQIPADGTWTADTINGQSVLLVDFEANEQILRDNAYAATKEMP
ncbi:MAG: LCP family protein [Oscillospiraceae bacterium]|nr:LCP family protein [Oscillospiraceae bacterium]